VKPTRIDAIGFLVLVCVAGLGYFGLVHRQNSRFSLARENIGKFTRANLANDGLSNVLDQDRAQLVPLREKLREHTSTFAGKKEIDGFLRRFAAEAEDAGVTVSLLRPGEVEKVSWYEVTPISVSLEGEFGRMYRLIRSVETGQSMATIKDIQINGEPGKADCRATLTVNLYHNPDDGA
jgi:Tfp pilus assembly protein PilO